MTKWICDKIKFEPFSYRLCLTNKQYQGKNMYPPLFSNARLKYWLFCLELNAYSYGVLAIVLPTFFKRTMSTFSKELWPRFQKDYAHFFKRTMPTFSKCTMPAFSKGLCQHFQKDWVPFYKRTLYDKSPICILKQHLSIQCLGVCGCWELKILWKCHQ